MQHLPDRIDCQHYQTGKSLTIKFEDNEVKQIVDAPLNRSNLLMYAPVFVDLQINGYQGVNFGDSDNLTAEDVKAVVNTLHSHGVGYFLPTITTGSFANTQKCFEILSVSCQDSYVSQSIPGFHLEGPYISSEDGPRGAHPMEHARPPSWDEFRQWQDAANGMIKLVTLAPELPGAIPFIEKLRTENIIPAIGHTNAQASDIEAAVKAGAVLSTHLGNGAHAQIRRHPNYIWDQLANDSLWASLIADGFHLPPNVLKVMVRAKGIDKSILVTDAVTIAGLTPGSYNVRGKAVELTSEGVVKLSGTDYLAGAALKMPDAVFNAVHFGELEPHVAIDMASNHPLTLLHQFAKVSSVVFDDKTFTLLNWSNDRLEVVATVIDGRVGFYQPFEENESGIT